MRRALLPALVLLSLSLGGMPALAEPVPAVPAPGDAVVVTAAVRTPDGGLVFRSRPASSAARGEALADRWDDDRGVVAADVGHRVTAAAVDRYRPLQWGLDTLHAEQSWTTATGTGVVVAVVDTGVQGDHPDLVGQVLPPIDLVEPSATRTVSIDPNGHGTHVAGIVAAATGNGIGVAGLAPGARVLPVRVLDADGSGYDDDVAEGVVRAVDAGAQVVNLSLGGPEQSDLLEAAVQYALAHGVVVVSAAGNEGLTGSPVEYPAATPGVLAVGATDSADQLASFSSTGSFVDLVAPGVSIASTGNGGQYWYLDGTSMAAPFVSASAALLLSAHVPAAQVAQRLQETARDLGAPGRDDRFGSGLVDVVAALRPVPATTAPAVLAPVSAPVSVPGTSPVAAPVSAPVLPPAPRSSTCRSAARSRATC
ncbi:MAG: peptidase, partial [Frankiales bacterium]|nr:peptidase [Frankiales bacterium]